MPPATPPHSVSPLRSPDEGGTDRPTLTLLQTSRLGDLWFTTPMAWHFHQQGYDVEVAYHASFGNPFTFFPYIRPVPLPLTSWAPRFRFQYLLHEMTGQPEAWLRLRKLGPRKIVWPQIYPWRLLPSILKNKPYSECMYERYPEIPFRQTRSTLPVTPGDTLLVFTESQSIPFVKDAAYFRWISENIERIARATGLRPVSVLYGNQTAPPNCEIWRGSLEDYQRLIAGCGAVYGICTSAHVLGQLLGKPIVTLYQKKQQTLGRIGEDTVSLGEGEMITPAQLASLDRALRHNREHSEAVAALHAC